MKPSPTPDDLRRLQKEAVRTASKTPRPEWIGVKHKISDIVSEDLHSLEDNAIGWSTHYFGGKRGNIQKDEDAIARLIMLVKTRLWLRLHYHNSLHTMSPTELVDKGLIDPVPLFVKGEGHPLKKQLTKRWRLIWNVSQLDISIEMFICKTFNKTSIVGYQTDAYNTSAIGCGHHDDGLQRFGRTFEMLKSLNSRARDKFPDLGIQGNVCYSSDASGWDLSVSAYSAWGTVYVRALTASTSLEQLLVVNNGFFGTNHVVHTGEEIFEMNKAGVTASGKNSTGTDNGNTRSTVARACQPEEIVDALLGEAASSLIWQIMLWICSMCQQIYIWGTFDNTLYDSHAHTPSIKADATLAMIGLSVGKSFAAHGASCMIVGCWDEPEWFLPTVKDAFASAWSYLLFSSLLFSSLLFSSLLFSFSSLLFSSLLFSSLLFSSLLFSSLLFSSLLFSSLLFSSLLFSSLLFPSLPFSSLLFSSLLFSSLLFSSLLFSSLLFSSLLFSSLLFSSLPFPSLRFSSLLFSSLLFSSLLFSSLSSLLFSSLLFSSLLFSSLLFSSLLFSSLLFSSLLFSSLLFSSLPFPSLLFSSLLFSSLLFSSLLFSSLLFSSLLFSSLLFSSLNVLHIYSVKIDFKCVLSRHIFWSFFGVMFWRDVLKVYFEDLFEDIFCRYICGKNIFWRYIYIYIQDFFEGIYCEGIFWCFLGWRYVCWRHVFWTCIFKIIPKEKVYFNMCFEGLYFEGMYLDNLYWRYILELLSMGILNQFIYIYIYVYIYSFQGIYFESSSTRQG